MSESTPAGVPAATFPITTGLGLTGAVIERDLGLAFGLVVRSMGFAKSFGAGLTSLRQGEVPQYTRLLEDSRRHAIDRMVENARLLGELQQRTDELVAAHADVPVDLPDRRPVAVLAEGTVPGARVLVVAVDEGAVDVEEDRRPLAQVTASSVTSSEISSSERFLVSGNRSAKKTIAATPKPA